MGKLNELNCAAGAVGNIARPACEFDPGHEVGTIFLPVSFEFTEAETASEDAFRAALLAHSIDDDANDRIFGVSQYEDWSPSGEAAQDQTFGSGLKRRVREATMQTDYTLVQGKYYHKAVKLTLHNKQSRFSALRVFNQGDGTYVTVGSKKEDVSLNDVLGGFSINSLNVSDYIYPVSGTVGTFTVQLGFTNPIDVDTNFALIQTSFNPLDVIEGLQSVELTATSTGPTNVTVRGLIPGTGDLSANYGADLAVVGAWVVKNAEPGSADFGDDITITTVTQSGVNYVLTLATTGVDTDNPGTGGRVSVNLAAPSVLSGLVTPVEGIEGIVEYVELG